MKHESNVTKLDMNLQLLASEGEAGEAGESTAEPVAQEIGQEPVKKEEKTFTQEEVNKMIEKRLAREKAKAEQERLEAEELAKLSEAERQKKLFEKQVAEFEAERAEWQASRLKEETRNQLRERNMLSDFDEFVLGADAEATLDKLNRFETLLNKAVELAVNERLKGKAPKTSASGSSGEMTKEQFRKLNIVEKQALLASNPTLFTELNK